MSTIFVSTNEGSRDHKEGDVWVENGKTWTIRNGIKRTVSKMDTARQQLLTPLACPKCNRAMKHHLDEKMWNIHKQCFECTIDMEHEIMKAGNWSEYEKTKILANANAFCEEMESTLQEYIQESVSKTNVTEDGSLENWKDASKEHLQNIVDNEVSQLKEKIKNYKEED